MIILGDFRRAPKCGGRTFFMGASIALTMGYFGQRQRDILEFLYRWTTSATGGMRCVAVKFATVAIRAAGAMAETGGRQESAT